VRLFTGIDPPPEVSANLAALVTSLKPLARLKWSPAENFHITTKFIGEWPESRIGELCGALGALARREPVSIAVRAAVFLPSARAPRALCAGVEAGPPLERLARETCQTLARLGVKPETRAYSPHLTLARMRREPVPLDALHAAIAKLAPLEFGRFTARSFFLYQSRAAAGGSVYTKLAEFKFE
jgi:2'-5' RNA ligase